MFKRFVTLCRLADIDYSIDGGTPLAAIRSQKFIPWDYDVDVIIFSDDQMFHLLQGMHQSGFGYDLSRLEFKFAPLVWEDEGCKKPTLDVCLMIKEDGKYLPKELGLRACFPEWWYLEENMFPLRTYMFEGQKVTGPNKPEPWLTRFYGDWQTPTPEYKYKMQLKP